MLLERAPSKTETVFAPKGSKFKCDGCGVIFISDKSKYTKGKHFCNKACYMKHAKKTPLRIRGRTDYYDPAILEDISD